MISREIMECGGGRFKGYHPGLIFGILVIAVVLDNCVAQAEFRWTVDSWTSCEVIECGKTGKQYRNVWCQLISSNHPVLNENCNGNLKPAEVKDCIRPCTEENTKERYRGSPAIVRPSLDQSNYEQFGRIIEGQAVEQSGIQAGRDRVQQHYPGSWTHNDVEWVVDPWGSCQLVPGANTCGRNSGIQHRNVTCERKERQGKVEPSRCEAEEPKPATSQSCELLCRQDCVVSTYSHWSTCDTTCQLSNQTRTRTVIVPPRHRGSQCPELSQMILCDNCTGYFMYRLSDWLPCSPITASYFKDVRSHHLIGYQIRDISCLQHKGLITSLSFCAKMFPNVTLMKHRVCVMPHDCQVSSWSALSPHNNSCIDYDGQIKYGFMVRTRQILQMPLGDGTPCPSSLIEYVRISQEDSSLMRPCQRGKWIISSWGQCQFVPGYNKCGTGVRTRRAVCVEADEDGTERPVGDERCAQTKPIAAQSCSMECSWDCSVAHWGPWSTCQEKKCERPDLRKRQTEGQSGKRFRTREILTPPGPGGNLCPHLSETRMCEPEPCFTWNVTFGPCEATSRGACGEGTQLKKAVCLNQAGEKVRERFCHESLHSEQSWANCYVPCPEDCVLSEWGGWSSCPDPCLIQDSMRSRQRHILAYHGPGRRSRQCPHSNALVQTEQCPVLYDCLVYQWEVTAWGQCQLGQINPSSKCGHGTQNRTVDCYTSKGVRTPQKCEESVKPRTTQSCIVDCPVDCHVTEWSAWSDCGVKCLPVQSRHNFPNQMRRRVVLQLPQNGGVSCPTHLREEQPCTDIPVCLVYHWETTSWSDCIIPPVVPLCGQGLKARNITCYQSDEKGTQMVPLITCLENLGLIPDMTEVCYIPCETECHFSPWTQWTLCGVNCEKTRFRVRRLLDDGKSNPKCHSTDLYPRDEHQDCVCDSVQPVLIGGWSDCIIQSNRAEEDMFAKMSLKSISGRNKRTNETGSSAVRQQTYCGDGKRYMVFSCQTNDDDGQANRICTGEEYQEETCTIPCPVDCKTSPWSTWSPCSTSCGAGLQQRERQILTIHQNGGRRCPFLYGQKETQTKLCDIDCNYNSWKVENWESCVPSEGRTCGEGTQRRVVRCVTIGPGRTEIMSVDDNYCSSHHRPEAVGSCTLACPGECVMSEWTPWTKCAQPCTGKQVQTRSRSVLRMPSSYAVTQNCQHQLEERLCEKWKNCFVYTWDFSEWTSCLVNYGEAECGVGHKERFAFCRDEKGERIESNICEELFGQVTEPMVVSCEVPCDSDCLISDWTEWTTCSVTCGLGTTRRKRTILQNTIGNGKKCPAKLDEVKPCFQKGCYKWHISEWSHCIIQKGVCGNGIQERNISCLNDGGRLADVSKCEIEPEVLIMQTSQSCHVPCPGECKLSEWSGWSSCYISCEDFDQGLSLGVQARSRAILAYPSSRNPACNNSLWEDRGCDAQQCTNFSWVATSWNSFTFTREIHCERSDGLRVIGGCDESQVPPTVLTCTNPVCLPPAKCVDVNVCSCPPGEGLELHSINSTASNCTMNSTAVLDPAQEAAQMAKAPNIWMYAVIAIGTLFVIAVTAALYNMCELFRTGPRPRRKGQLSRNSSSTGMADSAVKIVRPRSQELAKMDSRHAGVNHIDAENGRLLEEDTTTGNSSNCRQIGGVLSLSQTVLDTPDTDEAVVHTPSSHSPNTTVATSPVTASTPDSPIDGTDRITTRSTGLISQVGSVASYRSLRIEPRLPHKRNRKYKRLHRFLPSKIINCLTCSEPTQNRMLHDTPANSNNPRPLACYHEKPLPTALTSSNSDIEAFISSSPSDFKNHNCMLPHCRPSKLDLQIHDRQLCDDSITDDLSMSIIDEMDRKMKRISPSATSLLASSTNYPNSSKHASSDFSKFSSLPFADDVLQFRPQENSVTEAQVHGQTTKGDIINSIHQPHNLQSGLSVLLPPDYNSLQPNSIFNTPHNNELPSINYPFSSNKHLDTHDPTIQHTLKPSTAINSLKAPSFDSQCLHNVPLQTCNICIQPHSSYRTTFPFHNQRPLSATSSPLSSPSSFPSPGNRHQNETPSKSIHTQISSSSSFPVRHNEACKRHKNRKLSPSVTIFSSASLPENLIHSSTPLRAFRPFLHKISQDSGHSTIPRSQTASLDDYTTSDKQPLAFIRDPRHPGLHVQPSLESREGSPASGLCDRCRSEMTRSGVMSLFLSTSNSNSQASNICGMETSV